MNDAHRWTYGGKEYFLFDTKRGIFISPGDEVFTFRGEATRIRMVSRGTDYNGTAKVIDDKTSWEYYSQVYDLKALPVVEAGREYQLDILDRTDYYRHLHMVLVQEITGDLSLRLVDVDSGDSYVVQWADVFIANQVGVDTLISA